MRYVVPSIRHLSNEQPFRNRYPIYETPSSILSPSLYVAQKYLTASQSTPIPPDPHTPKPLPQLPGPARAPPHASLPVRIFLPIARGPRLPLHAHRSPLGGCRGHFDGVGAFGCVAGVLHLVLLEGLFEGVGGLAFAFEVIGEVLLVGG